jgi:hypothetical protein
MRWKLPLAITPSMNEFKILSCTDKNTKSRNNSDTLYTSLEEHIYEYITFKFHKKYPKISVTIYINSGRKQIPNSSKPLEKSSKNI